MTATGGQGETSGTVTAIRSHHRRSYSAITSPPDNAPPTTTLTASTPSSPVWHDDDEFYTWTATHPTSPLLREHLLAPFTPDDGVGEWWVEAATVVAEGRYAVVLAVKGDDQVVCKVAKADAEAVRQLNREKAVLLERLKGVDGVVDGVSGGQVTIRGIARPAILLERAIGTLHDRITADPAVIVKRMFEALHNIHRRGVIHGDLKPQNIFITAQHHIVIGDFGLSLTAMDNPEQIVGTPLYQPPETHCSKEADVYAMTVSAWSVLSGGEEPFGGLTGVRLMLAIRNAGFLALHQEPVGGGSVWRAIRMGASKAPGDRPTCAQILLALNGDQSNSP